MPAKGRLHKGFESIRRQDSVIEEHFDRIIRVHLKDRGQDPQYAGRPFGEAGMPLAATVRVLKKRAFKYAAN